MPPPSFPVVPAAELLLLRRCCRWAQPPPPRAGVLAVRPPLLSPACSRPPSPLAPAAPTGRRRSSRTTPRKGTGRWRALPPPGPLVPTLCPIQIRRMKKLTRGTHVEVR
ncbi:hypothetical protein PVAP13_5KG358000 [Panicum virgatum]|uniref:Uncharacterized protein n=1 Tax=Panicum virgatum TaxID=38727 RepID=A0A8T0SMW1_PANVG|nr:hypothetical protein PVAP13_5KG358000 [Panicum virgatum]